MKLITRDIGAAGKLLDVAVLDHLIIGQGRFVSMRERGRGFNARSAPPAYAPFHRSGLVFDRLFPHDWSRPRLKDHHHGDNVQTQRIRGRQPDPSRLTQHRWWAPELSWKRTLHNLRLRIQILGLIEKLRYLIACINGLT